jgi:adenine-specific DNA-methyltransferase
MLFEEFKYFNFQFPEPQYLGAKHTHLAWVNTFIPKNIDVAVDAFAGSQTVAFLLKQIGIQVITNDFLNFNHQIGLGLIENSSQKLTKTDLELLFQKSQRKDRFQLIEQVYSDIFLKGKRQNFWIISGQISN